MYTDIEVFREEIMKWIGEIKNLHDPKTVCERKKRQQRNSELNLSQFM